mgnify:CR=1 FL=1
MKKGFLLISVVALTLSSQAALAIRVRAPEMQQTKQTLEQHAEQQMQQQMSHQ